MMAIASVPTPQCRSRGLNNTAAVAVFLLAIVSLHIAHSLTNPNGIRAATTNRLQLISRSDSSPPTFSSHRSRLALALFQRSSSSSTEDDIDSLLHGEEIVATFATSTTSLNAKTTTNSGDDDIQNDIEDDHATPANKAVNVKASTTNSTTLVSPPLTSSSPPVTPTTLTTFSATPSASNISPLPPPPPIAPALPPPPSPPPTSVTTFATPTSRETTSTTSTSTAITTNNNNNNNNVAAIEPVGIGGKGGLVYDVNRLKRNLLQETLRAYKRELWDLLSSPTSHKEDDIVNKLAALVQASPVSTTTDSNLLDGDWVLAYRSQQSASSVLLDPRRFARANRLKRKSDTTTTTTSVLTTERVQLLPTPFQGIKGGGIFRTFLRTYTLEDVDDPRAPYIVDTWRLLGGLVLEKRFYALTGLSRSTLELDLLSKEWYILGGDISIHNVTYSFVERPRAQVQVIYSDVDLCITSEDGGPNSPFLVFTKNEAWMDRKQRFRRKVKFVLTGLEQVAKWVLPMDWMQRKFVSNTRDLKEDSSKILLQVKQGNSSVRVLKLGSTTEDEVAWDGEMDPFVHMSADERQEQLRAMNVRQIDRAQRRQQAKARRERLVKWLVRRKTFFRKPDKL